jgi:hypothetical protein
MLQLFGDDLRTGLQGGLSDEKSARPLPVAATVPSPRATISPPTAKVSLPNGNAIFKEGMLACGVLLGELDGKTYVNAGKFISEGSMKQAFAGNLRQLLTEKLADRQRCRAEQELAEQELDQLLCGLD